MYEWITIILCLMKILLEFQCLRHKLKVERVAKVFMGLEMILISEANSKLKISYVVSFQATILVLYLSVQVRSQQSCTWYSRVGRQCICWWEQISDCNEIPLYGILLIAFCYSGIVMKFSFSEIFSSLN